MENNHIGIYKNALDDKICDSIVEIHNHNHHHHVEGYTLSGVNHEIKKSTDMNLISIKKDNSNIEKIILPSIKSSIRKCLYKYTTRYEIMGKSYNIEDFTEEEWIDKIYEQFVIWPGAVSVKKYNKGDGYYHWHQDMGRSMVSFARQLVIQFYLNDVEEGGETDFCYQNIKCKPEKGTILMFPAGFTHRHRGKMPISGDKYIMNLWLLHKIPPINDILSQFRE